jgi:uncharacterized protein (DUF1697 family)
MSTCIALFRGINVGGKNILPMKELVHELETLGLEDVRSYIQSGNVVFRSPIRTPGDIATRIATQVESSHGFSPRVLILSAEHLEQAIAANPFPEGETDPKSLHLFFLESTPAAPDLPALASVCAKSERFHYSGSVFYLHAADGIGRSRLAASVEKKLGVVTTARNWRTVTKLREMVQSI